MKIILPLILVGMLACNTTKNYPQSKANQQIQLALDKLVAANVIPGLSCSIIKADGQQLDFSSGFADIAAETKLTSSHLLFSGSIGKTYAVALLMQLVDQGKVDLERKILTYLPDYDWLDKLPNIQDITVRMLLSHTSGLPRWVMKPEVWATLHENPDKVWSYKDRLEYVFNEVPVHEPGKSWAYSDTNYLLLGLLIETIEKQAYYKLLEEKILKPYKLKQTVPGIKRKIPNLAIGYSKLPASFKIPGEAVTKEKGYVFNPQMEWTGGGMVSSTPDLAKWGKVYYTSSIFSESLRQQITTINPVGEKVMYDKHSYGMGSFIYATKHGKAYGHSGFMPGFNAIFAYYPDLELTIALQINCDYGSQKMKLVEYLDAIVETVL